VDHRSGRLEQANVLPLPRLARRWQYPVGCRHPAIIAALAVQTATTGRPPQELLVVAVLALVGTLAEATQREEARG